jgi:hypothetical protein
MQRMAYVAVLVLLSGCASQQQIAEQRAWALGNERYNSPDAVAARTAAAAATRSTRDAEGDAQCRSYGVKRGTQEYINCRMSLNSIHEQQVARAQAAAALEQAQAQQAAAIEEARQRCRSRALMAAGATMMASQSPNAGVGVGQGVQQGVDYARASGC